MGKGRRSDWGWYGVWDELIDAMNGRYADQLALIGADGVER